MNLKHHFKTLIACYAGLCSLLLGCTNVVGTPTGEISSMQADTIILLKDGNSDSPSCSIVMDFMYLKPGSVSDSLSNRINKTLQRVTFGSDYTNMSPSEAMNQAINNYMTSYRNELLPYYEADLKKGMQKEELPPWYNYHYTITSELSVARDSIYNYIVTNHQFTGGAHPNSFSSWTNIITHSGKVLTKEDVFVENSEEEVIQLIGQHLLEEVNSRLETDSITSIQGLRDNGILLNVDLYNPDNFLVTDEGVKFLYNRYDIAPYVVGDFQITVPYAEIENLMKMK